MYIHRWQIIFHYWLDDMIRMCQLQQLVVQAAVLVTMEYVSLLDAIELVIFENQWLFN